MKYLKVMIICIALLIVVEGRVYAYTDPGSGTMLLQMLAAILVGLLFYIRRIKMWVSSLFNKKKAESQNEPGQPEPPEGTTRPIED